ncbi:MAG: EAL domain-containing protein [Roseiarcus sp.]|uniref:EAL domain-containing protein n=1 Tax=Roseiarcus sp. TaxID=1969460 RepID=UPI003C18F7A1
MRAKRQPRHDEASVGGSALDSLLRAASGAQSAVVSEQQAEIGRLTGESSLFHAAIEALPQGVCVFDRQARLAVCNRRYAELYRLDVERLKPGVAWREIVDLRLEARTLPLEVDDYLVLRAPMRLDEQARQWRDKLSDGRTIAVRRQALPDGGWISTHEDVTEFGDQRAGFDERVSLQTLIDCLHDNLWVKDVESRFVICNKVTATRMGFSETADMIGKNDLELLPLEIAQKFFDDEQKIIRTGRPMIDLEEYLYDGAGGKSWLLTTKVPVRNARGDIFGVAGVSRDITDRRLSNLLRDGQAQILEMIAMSAPLEAILDALARLVESQLNGILCSVLLLDEEGRRLRHAAAPSLAPDYIKAIDGAEIGPSVGSCGTAAYRRQPVIVTDILADPLWADFRELVRPYGYRSCWSTPILSDRGEALAVFAMYSRAVRAPTSVESRLLEMAIHIAGIAIARRRAEERIQFMATHDELTGLPNRAQFGEQLAGALQAAAQRGAWLCVVYIDFDNFKYVNDSLGHGAGDSLLKTMAERMVAAVGPNDIVSRLGGDEFVVLLIDPPKDRPTIGAMLHRIRSAVVAPVELDGRSFRVTSSFGAAIYPIDGGAAETLLANADAAMYGAKESGGDGLVFYVPEINANLRERLTLLEELRNANPSRDFVLHYQPQVDLRSGEVFAVEALIRWRHPRLGLAPPATFIPIAEESGLIVPIGDWALREACRQNKTWQDAGLPPIAVSVNVSARQFRENHIVAAVAEALAESGLEPKYLELELTESLVMRDVDRAIETMKELRALGVRLSIDDFGTGYSSLSALKRFPVERLKIDRSFIQDLPDDEDDRAVASAVISLGQKLNLRVIAEGVETEAQVAFLRENHCDELQGYHFSRPVAADAIPALLLRQAIAPASRPAKKRRPQRRPHALRRPRRRRAP